MATIQLFKAVKGTVQVEDPSGEATVYVKEGLSPALAKVLARRLNRELSDEELQTTIRQQSFDITINASFNLKTLDGDVITEKSLAHQIKRFITDCVGWNNIGVDDIDWDGGKSKVDVKVVKVYDKEIPNV